MTIVGTVRVGGLQRTYWLHIPTGYVANQPMPLVLSFHGHGSTGLGQQAITGFSSLADRAGFLVVYPQGVVGPDGSTGWATGPRNDPTVNDVGFVSALLSQVESLVCVDASRIYATGFSNGGAMTAMLACTMTMRIAAFASVSGSYFPFPGGCHPARTVPLLEIHGTADHIVPYLGSAARGFPNVPAWLATWARRDGCTVGPTVLMHTVAQRNESWTNCMGHVVIVHYARIGGGHVWPRVLYVAGAKQPQHTDVVIWTFLKAYALPPATTHPSTQTAAHHNSAPGARHYAVTTPRVARASLLSQ